MIYLGNSLSKAFVSLGTAFALVDLVVVDDFGGLEGLLEGDIVDTIKLLGWEKRSYKIKN